MTSRHKFARAPDRLPPASRAGYLYYLRLNTAVGFMYKLGFTTLSSPQERLAYQGKGHEKLIDAVLCFAHLNNAWEVEQELHTLFLKKALFYGGHDRMPLYENGQSELYREDVLGMDAAFTADQSEKTRVNILAANFKNFGASESKVQELIENEEAKYRNDWLKPRGIEVSPVGPLTLTTKVLRWLLGPVLWLFLGFFDLVFRVLLPNEQRSKKRVLELMKEIEAARWKERHERARKAMKLMKELDEK